MTFLSSARLGNFAERDHEGPHEAHQDAADGVVDVAEVGGVAVEAYEVAVAGDPAVRSEALCMHDRCVEQVVRESEGAGLGHRRHQPIDHLGQPADSAMVRAAIVELLRGLVDDVDAGHLTRVEVDSHLDRHQEAQHGHAQLPRFDVVFVTHGDVGLVADAR